MFTLGLNAAFHDSSACIIRDGAVLAAAEEERFTRIKHAKRPIPFSAYELPFNAIDYCLREARISISDLDHIAYSFDPFQVMPADQSRRVITLPLEPSAHPPAPGWENPWDALFVSSILNAPRHLTGGVPHHLLARLSGRRKAKWHFVPHHLAHAASAYLPSPFSESSVLTLDGRGEKVTSSYWAAQGSRLHLLSEVSMPHSLGLLYERVTTHLGFLHSSDEYKVMALASFARPTYLDVFRSLIHIGDEGRYTIDPLDTEAAFGPARLPGEALQPKHFEIAASLQVVLEETVLQLAAWLRQASGSKNLCLAGGVALNCVMNSKIRDARIFDSIWVQPASGDSGTALGAGLVIDAQERGLPAERWTMDHALLGPAWSDDEIEVFLKWSKTSYEKMRDPAEETAKLLADGALIGWFQGRMEYGPRALGARSILASPLHAEMQIRLNELKGREDFRPVAPVVLEEHANDWFEGDLPSPFMLFVHKIRPGRELKIAAARHVDGTARIQTIRREQNPRYHGVLEAFYRRTGVPILINTSFNTRSEPIVCSPRDALECFWSSPLDALAIGSFLVRKGASPR